MESINLCRDVLVTTARDRYQQWNNIVDTIKYILRDIFEEVNETYPKDVSKNVEWVLLNYLVEKEYEDLYPNGYYQKWIKWYFAGHHICGWQGEFPDGKLIIYLVTCRPFLTPIQTYFVRVRTGRVPVCQTVRGSNHKKLLQIGGSKEVDAWAGLRRVFSLMKIRLVT